MFRFGLWHITILFMLMMAVAAGTLYAFSTHEIAEQERRRNDLSLTPTPTPTATATAFPASPIKYAAVRWDQENVNTAPSDIDFTKVDFTTDRVNGDIETNSASTTGRVIAVRPNVPAASGGRAISIVAFAVPAYMSVQHVLHPFAELSGDVVVCPTDGNDILHSFARSTDIELPDVPSGNDTAYHVYVSKFGLAMLRRYDPDGKGLRDWTNCVSPVGDFVDAAPTHSFVPTPTPTPTPTPGSQG